ncbi:MAG: hypothetical protein R3F43_29095 [bacterium]
MPGSRACASTAPGFGTAAFVTGTFGFAAASAVEALLGGLPG